MRTLYLCYLSVLNALTESQVIPYVAVLARPGVDVRLVTFEPRHRARAARAAELAGEGIRLHTLPYHKRPSLPATAYDVVRGVIRGWRLVRAHRIEVLHARSHVPAAMALALKAFTGVRMLFDIRGLWADEYVDAEIWPRGGINFRLVKWLERRAVRRADGLVALTERGRHLFARDGAGRPGVPFEVIPCCVDLERFRPDAAWRREVRSWSALGDRPVVAYAGTLRRWYRIELRLDFWEEARGIFPKLSFLVLTGDDHAELTSQFAARGVPADRYRVLRVLRSAVPRYLAAADFAVLLVQPCASLTAASPTKIGEYLACGLPIALSMGVGDADQLLAEGVAVPVPAATPEHYGAAALTMAAVVGRSDTRARCPRVAERRFDLETVGGERYWNLYQAVAAQI